MNKKKSAHVRFTHVVQFGSVFFASCGLRIHHPTRKMYNISITIWPGKIERERERKKHGSKPKHTYQKALYMCLQSWASDWFFSRFSLSYSWLMCFCIGVQFGVNSFLSPSVCVCFFSRYFFNLRSHVQFQCTVCKTANKNMPRNPLHTQTHKSPTSNKHRDLLHQLTVTEIKWHYYAIK